MNIDEYGFDELLQAAAKAEVNSREVYEYLSNRSGNFVMKDRFRFLANEEQKHEELVRDIYEKWSDEELEIPEETPVPIPFIRYDEDTDESEIISQAMNAEVASRDFYKDMAEKAENEEKSEAIGLLNYLAEMEQNHYDILKSELGRIKEFEEFDEYYPAMHLGP